LTFSPAATATRITVKLGKAQEIEDAGNRVAHLGPAQIARFLEQHGFHVVESQRYAMVYKHHPGWVIKTLSLPVIHPLAWRACQLASTLIGAHGNKLTIQATRKPG
jgi:hypothetical protein